MVHECIQSSCPSREDIRSTHGWGVGGKGKESVDIKKREEEGGKRGHRPVCISIMDVLNLDLKLTFLSQAKPNMQTEHKVVKADFEFECSGSNCKRPINAGDLVVCTTSSDMMTFDDDFGAWTVDGQYRHLGMGSSELIIM